MAGGALLLGAVLTFATSEGEALQLTVALTRPATVSVDWGGAVRSSTVAALRHRLGPLPLPRAAPVDYALRVGGEPPRRHRVKPLGAPGPLRVALYGDSRDGPGPHRALVAAIAAADPHVLVHTGDVVRSALDEAGWVRHLAATLPLTARVPVVLALGNHELFQPRDLPPEQRVDALAQVSRFVPPPDDPAARRLGAPPGAFSVRAGPALFFSLDSNAPLGPGSPQLAWLEAALAAAPPRPFTFLALHHGPRSSGRHGGHPDGDALAALAERHGVTAVLAGHDHTYERILDRGVTYVVSGGGGAPLYQRGGAARGSLAFASTYNWVLLTLEGEAARLEARSLEGALLDEALLGERAAAGPAPDPRLRFGLAAACIAGALALAVRRWMRPSR